MNKLRFFCKYLRLKNILDPVPLNYLINLYQPVQVCAVLKSLYIGNDLDEHFK